MDERPPVEGEVVPQSNLARTYRELVDRGADAFYAGDLGRRLVRAVQEASISVRAIRKGPPNGTGASSVPRSSNRCSPMGSLALTSISTA
jgi:Gamma-glutamyltranspeptidase